MHPTIVHALFDNGEKIGTHTALREKVDDRWVDTSWADYARRVRLAARGLISLGLQPGEAVAIVGWNSPEWVIADLAALAAGGVSAPLYANCTAEQAAYVVQHSEARILLADTPEQIEKIESATKMDHVVQLKGEPTRDGALSFAELERAGEAAPESALEERLAALDPAGLATLIYTSGTTGQPKGVMLTHRNLVFTGATAVDVLEMRRDETCISYLPLSHIAEQIVSIHGPISGGGVVGFAESLERLGENLRELRPTLFLGVPRVWEKIQIKMMAAGKTNPPLKRKIVAWARGVGLEAARRRERGEALPWTYGLANRLVFSKVREKLGLERARVCLSSTAPIARSTLDFFASLGILIYEVYGMSETTGPHTLTPIDRPRLGSAGLTMPGCETKIAEDGEVLLRGDNAFIGYFKDEAATRQAIDEHGWVHSGDIGEIDKDGYLKITDRKKDLIVTAGGKNVAPQNLEALLKSVSGIGRACVIGDRRKHLCALLTIDRESAPDVAAECGAAGTTPEELAEDPAFRAHIQTAIDAMNARLARYETIKRFVLLPNELTVEHGELTPTLKMKRKVVLQHYAAQIDSMYEDEGIEQAHPG